jgi:nitrogen fixation-related uncharacterized protein
MTTSSALSLLWSLATVQAFAPPMGGHATASRVALRQQVPVRVPTPVAILTPETADVTTLVQQLPTAALLADGDVFGEVFMAGMSIAFAAIGATVFVGIVVRGKYDDLEQSFFDAQDEQLLEDKQLKVTTKSQVVSDFFGDVNPTEASDKSASGGASSS